MKNYAKWIAVMLLNLIVIPLQVQADPGGMWGGRDWGNSDCGMMGPGMMMGSGMGFGGMGMGYMMGGNRMMGMPGMMMGGFAMLDLSEKQTDQIGDIQTKLQKEHWQLMGKMIDEQANMRKTWSGVKSDPKKVGAAYAKLFDLQRQAIEARVEAMNKMYDTLTDKQREQLNSGPGAMWGQGGGGAMGRPGHMMMQ